MWPNRNYRNSTLYSSLVLQTSSPVSDNPPCFSISLPLSDPPRSSHTHPFFQPLFQLYSFFPRANWSHLPITHTFNPLFPVSPPHTIRIRPLSGSSHQFSFLSDSTISTPLLSPLNTSHPLSLAPTVSLLPGSICPSIPPHLNPLTIHPLHFQS